MTLRSRARQGRCRPDFPAHQHHPSGTLPDKSILSGERAGQGRVGGLGVTIQVPAAMRLATVGPHGTAMDVEANCVDTHGCRRAPHGPASVSYTHLRAHETVLDLVCRLLLEKKKKTN